MAFIVFAATNAAEGTELWRTDGTAAGTTFLLDINPGLPSSSPANFTRVGELVFFTAGTATGGSELWRTDGTAAGTIRVKDIATGAVGSFPTNLVDVNGTLYFSADDGSGQELWKSDGTVAGTVRVKDIVPGPNGSYPDEMINAAGVLYFTATSDFGTEVWRSDGTDGGTVLVNDTFPGSFASGASFLTYLGGKVFYVASNGTNGFGLWSTTGSGATLVKGEFALASDLMTAGGKLFFTVMTASNWQLWTSDGTQGGTHVVNGAGVGPANLTPFNGLVYFTATGANGTELWKSNGTTASIVADIAPGAASSSPADLEVVGQTLYFTATNGTDGVELWKTDGTAVSQVKNINVANGDGSSPLSLTAAYNKLLFSADDGTTGLEPWSSNGTTSGTVLLKEIAPGMNVGAGIQPDWLTVVGSQLFFRGHDNTHGDELWATDGSALGTHLVKDIVPGSTSGSPFSIFNANGIAIFNATTANFGQEPWRSDGTAAGTTILVDTRPGPTNGIAGSFTATTTHVYFFGLDPSFGYRLWTTDGTTSSVLYNSNVGLGSLTGIGSTLYFSAWDQDAGVELWKSNGTAAGTVRIADINPGGFDGQNWRDSSPSNFTEMSGAVYFTADTNVGGRELYKLVNDTVSLVKDIVPGSQGSNPSQLFNLNGLLLFRAGPSDDRELWRSDGTAAGTFELKDINTNSGGSSGPFNFVLFKDEAYFIANNAADPNNLNRELWKTNGTDAGTVLVKDINGTNLSSSIGELTVYGDFLYFAANDGVKGIELWRTDGTAAGTTLLKDINPVAGQGSAVNGKFDLTPFSGLLYFAANNGTDGPELWRTDGTVAGTFAVTDVQAPAASNPLGYGLLPNAAPTASTSAGTLTFTEGNAALVIDSGATVGDVDNTTLAGAAVAITGNFATGQDALVFTAQNGITGSYNAAAGVLTLSGEASLALYETALRSVKYSNTSEAPSTAPRTISIVVSDGIDPSTAATKTVNVVAINDRPTHVVPGAQVVDEDATLSFNAANANLIQVADVDIGGGTATVTLGIADGALALGSSPVGLTIVGAGTAHVALTGTLADLNTALDGLTYTPVANANGLRSLSIATNDHGNTGNDPGLSGDANSEEATSLLAISIASVNDAPAGADETVSTVPNSGYSFTVADFGFVDPVDGNAFLGIRIASSPGAGTLTNNNQNVAVGGFVPVAAIVTGKLLFTPGPNANGAPYTSFTFEVKDDGGTANGGIDLDQTPNTITVDVAVPNQPPTDITGGPFSVDENSANGTVVGTVIGQNPTNEVLTYALVGDAGGRFAINGTSGEITVANGALLDAEQGGGHSIVVRATDPGGLSIDEAFTILVTDINPEYATGTAQGDTMAGGPGDDRIDSGAGDDTVIGGGGNDTLLAGDGADWVSGGDGNDHIVGGAGYQSLNGDDGDDYLYGGGNSDSFFGGAGNDELHGGTGADYMVGGSGNDQLFGGLGDDVFYGGTGADVIDTGGGHDQIVFLVGDGADTVVGLDVLNDVVNLGAFAGVATFADVLARSSQQGLNTVINMGGGDVLTLANVQLATLHSGDFYV